MFFTKASNFAYILHIIYNVLGHINNHQTDTKDLVEKLSVVLFYENIKKKFFKFFLYLLIRYCKDLIWLESKTGRHPGPRSPNNEFIEGGNES